MTATVVISTNQTTHVDTGRVRSSSVYHSTKRPCANAPKGKHRLEVEESIALAFGRRLCGSCQQAEQRHVKREAIEELAQRITAGGIGELADLLPDGLELRVFAHPPKGKPFEIWSSIEGRP